MACSAQHISLLPLGVQIFREETPEDGEKDLRESEWGCVFETEREREETVRLQKPSEKAQLWKWKWTKLRKNGKSNQNFIINHKLFLANISK